MPRRFGPLVNIVAVIVCSFCCGRANGSWQNLPAGPGAEESRSSSKCPSLQVHGSVHTRSNPPSAPAGWEKSTERDTHLQRSVAIKILPESLATDVERLARFEREARVLASLNHPHIATIYGFEPVNGIQALILELVDGPTLADRLKEGPLPLNEALAIARQIAEALEAAHEKGIIHRDLKPANVAFTADGEVKVLDFGLAKALNPDMPAEVSHSPTLSLAATHAGVLLGTAAYMSPEQAKGRAADKRSDVWAFGCVLYEMLTGTRAFGGEDISDTLAAVLRGEPDWNALPASIPPAIRSLLERCLDKNRSARIADVSTALYVFDQIATVAAIAAPEPVGISRRLLGPAIVSALIVGGLAATLVAWVLVRSASTPRPRPARFAIVPPAAQPLNLSGFGRDVAISPDGTHIAYVGGTSRVQVMLRAIDSLDAVPLASTAAAATLTSRPREPFFSPDGRWIAFFAGFSLKKVALSGGPALTICGIRNNPRGGSWGGDNTIVFAMADSSTGLLEVSADGGEPKVLTMPDPAHGEMYHLFPEVLPGGQAILFTITMRGSTESSQVAVLDRRTGQRTVLVRGASRAVYLDPGYLLYAVETTIRAVRFDPVRLAVMGEPIPVVENVAADQSAGASNFAVSRQGTLVHVPGGTSIATARSLVWVDRQGRETPIPAPPRSYVVPRLSPDGTRVALESRDQDQDIWIWDFRGETLTRLTSDPTLDQGPVWTPDGRRIVFASQRAGVQNVFLQAADGTGNVERLTTSPNQQIPTAVSPDSQHVVVREVAPKGKRDLTLLTLGPPRRTEPLLAQADGNADISADGRWLAYQSDESGQSEIYVRPFPAVNDGRWQVSSRGGTKPVWARSGRELFYLDAATDSLTRVTVETQGATFKRDPPVKVLDRAYYTRFGGRNYDVAPDGSRFLMIKDNPTGMATSPGIVVVLNWIEELKARLPIK
jgi:serine/threonine-protein kinase